MPELIGEIRFDEIQSRVAIAIENFKTNEIFLLQHGLQERNIAPNFANSLKLEFPDWNVDSEYDKIIDSAGEEVFKKAAPMMMRRDSGKIIQLDELELVQVIPDIIIHQRGGKENLLAIEVKLSDNRREIAFDIEKLKAYRRYEKLKYRFALFLRFEYNPDAQTIIAPDGEIWI